jgi:xanthine/CO dehydrogenase XdhC/CoxF family maturation factor
MLIAADGRRTGTISGGCLEAEVARKAFWHTEGGPVVRRYSTSADDGEIPFGMGCGGVVHLLLERSATARLLHGELTARFSEREPLAIATVLEGENIGRRAFWPRRIAGQPIAETGSEAAASGAAKAGVDELEVMAEEAFATQRSFDDVLRASDGQVAAVRTEWVAARPGLFIFGAGDDAFPVARLAQELGWYVALADGRANLVTRTRFAGADALFLLPESEFPTLALRPTDAAVLMTHSLEQDTRVLGQLLTGQAGVCDPMTGKPAKLAYIGVLGPRRRTQDMLLTLAAAMPGSSPGPAVERQVAEWMAALHSPMGLDLGGNTPADIALAVMAEIQQARHRATGLSLREVRAHENERRAMHAAD